MALTFNEFVKSLESKIEKSYTEGVSLEDAEKLAGEFLYAQMRISGELKNKALDVRMKKAGLKAIKAQVYMAAATKTEKKPSDTMLEHMINQDEIVIEQQDLFDTSDCDYEELERYHSVFKEAHVHFRQLSKGKFE